MPVIPGHPRISVDPTYLAGKPRITGTRIGVDLILRYLSKGATVEWLLQGYPGLTREDIEAALAYAADQMKPMRRRKAKSVAAE